MRQPRGFLLNFIFRRDALVVTKLAAKKSAALCPAEPPLGTDEKTQDCATVVAGEVHGAVEFFPALRADQRPGFAQACAAAPARQWPDVCERC